MYHIALSDGKIFFSFVVLFVCAFQLLKIAVLYGGGVVYKNRSVKFIVYD
jgi:hypothetical protein